MLARVTAFATDADPGGEAIELSLSPLAYDLHTWITFQAQATVPTVVDLNAFREWLASLTEQVPNDISMRKVTAALKELQGHGLVAIVH